jgi:hypothetical protein
MVKLWIVMAEAFGFKWFKPMGEAPNQTWVQALRNLTMAQWSTGLKMLATSTDDWPPSLPEFRRWCTSQRTKEELRAEADQMAELIMADKVKRYNPSVIPMTYEQVASEKRRLANQFFVSLQEGERREGLEHMDPRRLCQDEACR